MKIKRLKRSKSPKKKRNGILVCSIKEAFSNFEECHFKLKVSIFSKVTSLEFLNVIVGRLGTCRSFRTGVKF